MTFRRVPSPHSQGAIAKLREFFTCGHPNSKELWDEHLSLYPSFGWWKFSGGAVFPYRLVWDATRAARSSPKRVTSVNRKARRSGRSQRRIRTATAVVVCCARKLLYTRQLDSARFYS